MYFADLILPRICPVCGRMLLRGERYLCLYCLSDLPYSYFWSWRGNPAENSFAGKIGVEMVSTLLIYRQESPYSKIVHAFKYQNRRGLCSYMGDMLGDKMAEGGWAKSFDFIIPVPLHPLKKWMRGYNQAEILSDALSERIGVPVLKGVLQRKRYTKTQTRKSAQERLSGMSGAFRVRNKNLLSGKNLLLVDDVMTTGATLSACAGEILRSEGSRVSIAALAFAE